MEQIERRNKRQYNYLKELIVGTHPPPEQKDTPDSPSPSSTGSHDEPDSGVSRLRGETKRASPSPSLFLRAEHARPQPGKNPSRHPRRKEEPCLPPSVAIKGLSPRVFVRHSQGSSPSLRSFRRCLSLLFVAICSSQGFVTKEYLFVLLALSKSNPMFAVFFLARRPSSIGFVLLAVVLSPSPSRRTSFVR
ncbi:uncharacterized protein LOC107636375 [Arachis ipaensis]|uniref:uncharacterized protein LOC107636375 n=1 Tax=Arachis ipaensis TaxID=130454 RepID=UPI0007AEF957|nr:uncharacterized protein LOC107636375 [Arachis ipaensis]